MKAGRGTRRRGERERLVSAFQSFCFPASPWSLLRPVLSSYLLQVAVCLLALCGSSRVSFILRFFPLGLWAINFSGELAAMWPRGRVVGKFFSLRGFDLCTSFPKTN